MARAATEQKSKGTVELANEIAIAMNKLLAGISTELAAVAGKHKISREALERMERYIEEGVTEPLRKLSSIEQSYADIDVDVSVREGNVAAMSIRAGEHKWSFNPDGDCEDHEWI